MADHEAATFPSVREHLLTGHVAAYVDRIDGHRVRLRPGQATGLHIHPGGVAGYVTEGEIAFQIEGRPAETLRSGNVFYEPPGARVQRFDNLSASEPATFIAFYLLTGDQPLILEATCCPGTGGLRDSRHTATP